MDILRKELNGIYSAQHLERELLPALTLENIKSGASAMANMTNVCSVVTDASCDRCYIYAGALGRLMGFAREETLEMTVDSSDEDLIYNRIHPEDLVEKRMLEYEFFKVADALPAPGKKLLRASCRLRMKDRTGNYRIIENTTRIAELSPAGKMWLILCCYDLSPDQNHRGAAGINPCLVNNGFGQITSFFFGERRKHLLTEREKEILRLVQSGKPSKRIAELLGISVNTVNRHRQNIIGKLSVGSCIEAIMAATAMKLI